jgi:hypothetical protein
MSPIEVIGDPDPGIADAVAAVAARCAPWVRLRIGRALTGGKLGVWNPDGDTGDIFVSTGDGWIGAALEVAHHEIWHAAECWLLPDAIVAVDTMSADGMTHGDAYLDEPAERRARLYAAIARAWDEGLRVPIAGADRAIAIMFAIYSGEFAKEVLSARARASRPPEFGLRRLWDFVAH